MIRADVKKISLLSGIEIKNIEVKAPKGYDKPVAKIKSLKLEYSFLDLFFKKLSIEELTVEDPYFNYEDRGDEGTNVKALLAKISGGEKKEEKKEEKKNEKKSDFAFAVEIKKLSIKNFCADADLKGEKAGVSGVNLSVSGDARMPGNKGTLQVLLTAAPLEKSANLTYAGADLDAALSVALTALAEVKDFNYAKLSVSLPVSVLKARQKEISAPKTDLELRLEGRVDYAKQTAAADNLQLFLSGYEMAKLKGNADNFLGDELGGSVEISKFALELEKLQPFLDALSLPYKASGKIVLTGALSGKKSDVLNKIAPLGTLNLVAQDVKVRAGDLFAVDDFSGNLAVASTAGQPFNNAKISADFDVKGLSELKGGFGARQIKISAKVDSDASLKPKAGVEISAEAFGLKNKEAEIKNAKANAAASVDMTAGTAKLDKFTIVAPGLINAELNAEAASLGKTGLAKLKIKTGKFADIIAWLPQNRREQIPRGLTLDGAAETTLGVKWNLSWMTFFAYVPEKSRKTVVDYCPDAKLALDALLLTNAPLKKPDPMSLPVQFDASLDISGLSVAMTDGENKSQIKNGSLSLSATGAPKKIKAAIDAKIEQISQGRLIVQRAAAYGGCEISPDEIKPDVSLQAAFINETEKEITIEGLALSLSAALPAKNFSPTLKAASAKAELSAVKIENNFKQRAAINGFTASFNGTLAEGGSVKASFLLGAQNADAIDQKIELENLSVGLNFAALLDASYLPKGAAKTTLTVEAGSINAKEKLPFSLEKNKFEISLETPDAFKETTINYAALSIPTLGVKALVNAKAYPLVNSLSPFETADAPGVDAAAKISVKKENAFSMPGGVNISGEIGAEFSFALRGDKADLNGAITSNAFSLSMTQNFTNETSGRKEKIERVVSIERLDMNLPISQTLYVRPKASLAPASNDKSGFDMSISALYDAFREYSRQKNDFELTNLQITEKSEGKLTRSLKFEKIALDLKYGDNALSINRMHIKALEGDFVGKLFVKLPEDKPNMPEIKFAMQVSGANLAYLNADYDPKKITPETEVAAIAGITLDMKKRAFEGRMDITTISLKQLDELLGFLDPNDKDPKIQKNRQTLKTAAIVKPKVELVSMWIAKENLNMDIFISSVPLIETFLQNVLDNLKLRRYSISPILNKYLPQDAAAEKTE